MILYGHDGANYNDPASPIYAELESKIPSVSWRSPDPASPGGFRLYFRDAREPWSSTGVVHFNDSSKTISITDLGRKLATGQVSSSDVFVQAMQAHVEHGEKPFGILAAAFLEPEASQGLTLQQLMGGVMQNFRPRVDNLASALANGAGATFAGVSDRRFRQMLAMLESVGAITTAEIGARGGPRDTYYIAWNSAILRRLARRTFIAEATLATLANQFRGDCNDANLSITAEAALRLSAACASKRFLILTGLAGSGKTKLAQAFARWLVPTHQDGQSPSYAVIAVGADWTGNENILGYPSGLDKSSYITKPALDLILHAGDHSEIPHFLILDEMNLSHVERYFADLLSAIESEEKIHLHLDSEREANGKRVPPEVALPKNLFIVGTVNVDETTYMFSPKVLDRANVIEFRVAENELESFLATSAKPDLSKLDGEGFNAGFGQPFVTAASSPVEVSAAVKPLYDAEMLLFFKALERNGAEFGYRTAYEAGRFVHFYKVLGNHADADTSWFPKAFDCVVFQKFLPKLHGSRAKLGPLLKALWFLCVHDAAGRGADALKAAEESKVEPKKNDIPANAPYPLSAEKICRMWQLLMDNGFASFAEA
jgi:energy-coupling factor transporter ATP-binding protein EcfA2